jgi:hypothetical protein
MREPHVVFARELLASARVGVDEGIRIALALPELMAAARTASDRAEVVALAERFFQTSERPDEPPDLDMRAADRATAAAIGWAVRRPQLVEHFDRTRPRLPLGSLDWYEQLMLTLAASWRAIAIEPYSAAVLVAQALAARRRERRPWEERWLQEGPAHEERALRLIVVRSLLAATLAAARGEGEIAQGRLARAHRADALGLLGGGHLARTLSACVRYRLGAEPPGERQ